MAGTPFGRYELLQRLSSGGMGEVFLARVSGVEGFEKPIVIKRIFADRAHNADYRRMFIREAKVAAGLVHPNIVEVFDLGEENDELYIAMELVAGGDLAGLLEKLSELRDHLPDGVIALIAFDTLEALSFAHARALVHQDVTPQNLLISLDGYVKLCDFGVAKILQGRDATTSGSIRGKFAYMAPEQLEGKQVDGRADVYSLGVVLYEAVTGARLFSHPDTAELLDMVRSRPVPPLAALAPAADPRLCAAIDRALKRDRNQRFKDADEFRTAIEPVLISAGPTQARHQLRDLVGEHFKEARKLTSRSGLTGERSAGGGNERSRGWTDLVSRVEQRKTAALSGAALLNEGATRTAFVGDAEVPNSTEPFTSIGLPMPPRTQIVAPPRRAGWGYALLGAAVLTGVGIGMYALREPPVPPVPPAPPSAALPALVPPQEPVLAVTATPLEPAPGLDEPELPDDLAAAADVPTEPAREARPQRRPAPRPRPPVEAPRASEFGFLNLNATPWAYVTIDGVRLSKPTPLKGHRLPAGKHEIVLETADGTAKKLSIEVRPDETTTHIVSMSR